MKPIKTTKITICPTCGSRKIKHVRKTVTREFEGKRYTVPNLEFYECPNCGEELYDRPAFQKIVLHSPAYEKIRIRNRVSEARLCESSQTIAGSARH
jgi:YgiT-type zinc finger domain-containing protein